MRSPVVSFLVAIAAVTSGARANFLGVTIRADSHAELGGMSLDSYDDASVLDPGVEFSDFIAGARTSDIDVSAETIRITRFDKSGTWDDTLDFNGLIFSDESVDHRGIDPIASVTVLGTTTMAGLDASRVSIGDDDHVLLEWGGLSFDPSTVVELRIGLGDASASDASAVPTPAAAPAGVALIASLSIRRRRRAV